ncbi:LamG domain-containing protein [Patescibacteria group bacterium]|nr:LamG domain-containing protein [Patescibacteria group bacterium]
MTILGAVFITPRIAEALNSHSVNFVRATSQYYSITDANQSGLDILGDATIEAWVKLGSAPGTDEQYGIVSKWRSPSPSYAYTFYYWNNASTGTNQLVFQNSDSGTQTGFAAINYTLPVGVWTHVAIVFRSGIPEIEMFVNGTSIGTASGNLFTSTFNSDANFEIGSNSEAENLFNGLVDEVRVWNIARTGSEIANGRFTELNPTFNSNLTGYWKFDTLDGSDVTANGNTLSPVNAPGFSIDVPFTTLQFLELLKVRKSSNESITNSTTLQPDDVLKLNLLANKVYIIDGSLVIRSTSGVPDARISIDVPSGTTMDLTYTSMHGQTLGRVGVLETSGTPSLVLPVTATNPTIVRITGTVKTGANNGTLQLNWAQSNANASATIVQEGGYLRGDVVQ